MSSWFWILQSNLGSSVFQDLISNLFVWSVCHSSQDVHFLAMTDLHSHCHYLIPSRRNSVPVGRTCLNVFQKPGFSQTSLTLCKCMSCTMTFAFSPAMTCCIRAWVFVTVCLIIAGTCCFRHYISSLSSQLYFRLMEEEEICVLKMRLWSFCLKLVEFRSAELLLFLLNESVLASLDIPK